MEPQTVRVHALVTGKVQGVNFRNSTRAHARTLGLVGVVRNLADGRVEVLAEGLRHAIEELVVYLHDGPLYAEVERVEAQYSKPAGDFESFEIQR